MRTPEQMRAFEIEHGLPPARPEAMLFSSLASLIPNEAREKLLAKRRTLSRKEGRSDKRRGWKPR